MTGDRGAFPFDLESADPPRRRRAWQWLVTLAVILVLVAAAAVAAEWLARSAVSTGVRQLVATQVDLPADQEVDVELDGWVLPQLVTGRLAEISVSAPDVVLGPVAGDVAVTLTDVPLRADAAAGPGTAQVRLDEAQVRALLGTIDGFPADTVGLAAPEVTMSTELSVFGAAVPIGVALRPGAADGALTLTPTSFLLGGAGIDAGALRDRFGGLADLVVRDWQVCIASHLPAALTLTAVEVDDDALVASFAIDGAVVIDPALRQDGTCP